MKIVLTNIVSLITCVIYSQPFEFLDINNIKARINHSYTSQFQDESLLGARFESPINSGKNTIFASHIWIGGVDSDSNVRVAANRFIQNSISDFQPGPVMDSIYYITQNNYWKRVWKINRSEIDYHVNNYFVTGYSPPNSITEWPGNGDTLLGQNFLLAPFYDGNGNGIYEPLIGEHPLINGDQAIFYIFNDDTIHAESGGEKLKIEIHAMAYSFNCNSDSALMNSIFFNYKYYNRGNETIYNTYTGVWTDTEIGCVDDDYAGTHVKNSTYYGINGDNFDEDCSGFIGYGSDNPLQSVTILAGPKVDSDGVDNPITNNINDAIDSLGIPYKNLGKGFGDGVIDNERNGLTHALHYFRDDIVPIPAIMGEPGDDTDYYNYMRNLWLNGATVYYGHADSNGYMPCNYMYPGESDPLFWGTRGIPVVMEWSMESEGTQPFDRRIIGSSGPFTFAPGEMKELDIAFMFNGCVDTLCTSYDLMTERTDSLHSYFASNMTPCGTMFINNMWPVSVSEHIKEISVSIFPNPANEQITVSLSDLNKYHFTIYNSFGQIVFENSFISKTTIDVSCFSNGIYYIKLTGEDNRTLTNKLVVSR